MLSAVLCSINMQYHEMNYGIAGQFDWLFRTAYANETRSRKPIVSQRFPISTCNISYISPYIYIYEFMSSTATYVNFKHFSQHNGQHIHWWIYMYVCIHCECTISICIYIICVYLRVWAVLQTRDNWSIEKVPQQSRILEAFKLLQFHVRWYL